MRIFPVLPDKMNGKEMNWIITRSLQQTWFIDLTKEWQESATHIKKMEI